MLKSPDESFVVYYSIFTFCSARLTCLVPHMCLFMFLNGGYYHIKTNLHMLCAILSRCDHEASPSVNYSDLCASICFIDANKIG